MGHDHIVDIAALGRDPVPAASGCEILGYALTGGVQIAEAGDVVLVLGKGHEQGQEIDGVISPFDDRVVLAQALAGVSSSGNHERDGVR